MSFNASISGDRWVGEALLPWAFFPPNVNKMNSYAIHGSGDGRTYEALYPVPREDLWEGQKPDLWVNWSVCLWLWIFVLFLGGFVWYGFWRVCYFLETKWYLKCKTNKANKTDTNLQNYYTNNHLQNKKNTTKKFWAKNKWNDTQTKTQKDVKQSVERANVLIAH